MRLLQLTLILGLSLSCLHADAGHKDKTKKQKATTAKQAKNKKPALDETYWRLSELNGKMVAQSGGNEAYIFLHKGKLTGNTGCNDISGKYEDSRRDNSLTFEPAVTEMACMGRMETETYMLNTLKGATRYRLNDNHLMIYNNALLLAIFEAKGI